MTAKVQRAHGLASFFRHNGAKVILGVILLSVLLDEVAQFTEAVVGDEAEGVR
jgi:hypothetical protein